MKTLPLLSSLTLLLFLPHKTLSSFDWKTIFLCGSKLGSTLESNTEYTDSGNDYEIIDIREVEIDTETIHLIDEAVTNKKTDSNGNTSIEFTIPDHNSKKIYDITEWENIPSNTTSSIHSLPHVFFFKDYSDINLDRIIDKHRKNTKLEGKPYNGFKSFLYLDRYASDVLKAHRDSLKNESSHQQNPSRHHGFKSYLKENNDEKKEKNNKKKFGFRRITLLNSLKTSSE